MSGKQGKVIRASSPILNSLLVHFEESITALTFSPNVLIVAHGGVYWAIQHAINIFDDHDLPNCTPILHIPPKDGQTVWKRKIIQVDIQLD